MLKRAMRRFSRFLPGEGAAFRSGPLNRSIDPRISLGSEDIAKYREPMFAYWGGKLGHPPATCEMFLQDAFNTDGYVDVVSRTLRVMGDVSGKAVLDVGCGWGGLSRVLAAAGARVTMVDPNPPHVEIARARVPSGAGIIGSGTDLLAAGLADASFDVVFVYSVIEHVGLPVDHRADASPVLDVQGQLVKEAARVLKPGGQMLISTGNFLFPLDQEVSIWFFHYLPRDVQKELFAMTGRSGDRYGLLTWRQLTELAEAAGLCFEHVETCDQDPWLDKLESWIWPLMTPDAKAKSEETMKAFRTKAMTEPEWMPMWHAFYRKPMQDGKL